MCCKTFWKATFSTKRRAKRPRAAPRWAADAEGARPGRTMEGFEETWTETLDRDTMEVEQRI